MEFLSPEMLATMYGPALDISIVERLLSGERVVVMKERFNSQGAYEMKEKPPSYRMSQYSVDCPLRCQWIDVGRCWSASQHDCIDDRMLLLPYPWPAAPRKLVIAPLCKGWSLSPTVILAEKHRWYRALWRSSYARQEEGSRQTLLLRGSAYQTRWRISDAIPPY